METFGRKLMGKEIERILQDEEFIAFAKGEGMIITYAGKREKEGEDESESGFDYSFALDSNCIPKHLKTLLGFWLDDENTQLPPVIVEMDKKKEESEGDMKKRIENFMVELFLRLPNGREFLSKHGVEVTWNKKGTKIKNIDIARFKQILFDNLIVVWAKKLNLGTEVETE